VHTELCLAVVNFCIASTLADAPMKQCECTQCIEGLANAVERVLVNAIATDTNTSVVQAACIVAPPTMPRCYGVNDHEDTA
jgi:hypothetical protein